MVFRDDRGWGDYGIFPVAKGQINISQTYPGVIRAFHRHKKQYDYWYLVQGNIEVVLSSGVGSFAKYYLGQNENLVIEPNIWHGFRVLGTEPAILLYFVSEEYDRKNPDEERAPWNAFYNWETEFK